MPGIGIGISPSFRRGGGGGITPIGAPTSGNRQFGDSITKNPYDFTVDGADGYTGVFDAAKSITSANYGYPSFGIYRGVQAMFFNCPTPDDESCSFMMGLNDVRASGAAAENMVIGGVRSALAYHYAKTIHNLPGSSTTGTWSNYNSGSPHILPTRVSNTIMASSEIGATLTSSFNGDVIFIGTQLQNIAAGVRGFTVHVDSVLKYTFDPSVLFCNNVSAEGSGFSNWWSPYAIMLDGLGSGAHTIEFTITAGTGTYFAWLDYIAEPFSYAEVGDTFPFAYLEVPHLNPLGYGDAPYDQASTPIIDAINLAVWNDLGVSYFKGFSNFGRVQTNNFYDASDDDQVLNGDWVHPNELGSANIAAPLISLMS